MSALTLNEKLQHIVDVAKENELQSTVNSWGQWKIGSYVFEISTHVFSFSALAVIGSSVAFPSEAQTIAYVGTVLQALSLTCKAVSVWCGKKFEQQAKIVNTILDSSKTGRLPELNLTPSTDSNTNNNGKQDDSKQQ